MAEKELAAVRKHALQLIRKHGWARLRRQEHNGRLGIVRALWMADLELNGQNAVFRKGPAWLRAASEIEQELRIRSLDVWNSRPGRTEEQVLDALKGEQQPWA